MVADRVQHNHRRYAYLNAAVQGATQNEMAARLCGLALASLRNGRLQHAKQVLSYMIITLNLECELSFGLYRLYRYCWWKISEGEPDEAARILRELQSTWTRSLEIRPEPKMLASVQPMTLQPL
jgi:flagellin-specific chaperone FliS